MKVTVVRKRVGQIVACVFMAVLVIVWWRMPIRTGPYTKQTLYVMLADAFTASAGDMPRAMWIDDDSGEGVFRVKTICDDMGIKATFAVVPAMMTRQVADSLAAWQRREGYGIALHGLNHDRWEGLNSQQVLADIRQSRHLLQQQGFDTTRLRPIIVPPHGSNTHAIRQTIRRQRCSMVTGANVVNPSDAAFMWGRLFITADTDTAKVSDILRRARRTNGFVVFGSHSSASEFNQEKMCAVLQMAKNMGFVFY